MTLNKIKNLRNKEGGFTIVELLIVIVIIGILAALVIVAYTGIQNRARDTQGKTDAQAIIKKAEAFAADSEGVYPGNKAAFAGKPVAVLDTTLLGKITDGATSTTAATAHGTYVGWGCGTSPNFTGYKISYWNSAKSGGAGADTMTAGTC